MDRLFRTLNRPSAVASLLLCRMLAARDKGRQREAIIWRALLAATYGIHVNPGAKIGQRLVLAHPSGQVIGSGVVIGDDVSLYQHVTLGARDEREDGYPTLENGVVIFAGAVVLGAVRIGSGAVVGANSVVLNDVEPGAVYVGNPARRIR